AVFHTAAVWQWNAHLETGNFVPLGQTAPRGLREARIQTMPSNLCQVDYTINTEYDGSIFEAQKKLEGLVSSRPGFNKGNKPRREWQQGGEGYGQSFVFSSQLFVKSWKRTRNGSGELPYDLHPWIAEAIADTDWRPNPDRPSIFDCVDGRLVSINEAQPPYLKRYDLVWISFFVQFIVGQNAWSPTFTPLEIIRVGTVPEELIDVQDTESAYVEEVEPKRRLKAGDTFVFGECYSARR
ncbi:hypothetical protein C8Q76DRAFT_616577, partial [Earliella scabrosa]